MSVKFSKLMFSKLMSFLRRAAVELAPSDVLIGLLYYGLGVLLRLALRAALGLLA
jgi:hypothetical protein